MLDQHPPQSVIAAYCAGMANADEIEAVEEHIMDCDECARLVFETVRNTVSAQQT